MTELLSVQEMLDHFNVHARAEFERDIDLTMATVCDEPSVQSLIP